MPKFKIPQGFILPEGTLEGEKFQVVMTAKVENGEVEISEMEGIAIDGYEDEGEPEKGEEGEVEEETETVPGETPGDRFNKKFRGKVAAY